MVVYEYETSPRKTSKKYIPRTQKRKQQYEKLEQQERNKRVEQKEKAKKKRNTQKDLKVHTENYEERKKQRALETKKNAKVIFDILLGFAILLLISYRYALINAKLSDKESLKTELSTIQKQNAQLKVSIEQGMNIKTIEQAAKEKLGMQKLDNNQKIYVSLDKKDYTESSVDTVVNNQNENWFQKILKAIRGE